MSIFILLFVLLMQDGSVHTTSQAYPTAEVCKDHASQLVDIANQDDSVGNAFWICEELPIPADKKKGSI